MRIRTVSLLVLVAGLAVVAAPMSPALADRGRGSDDTHQDDRGGRRNGSDDRRDDDRGRGRGSDDSGSGSSSSSSSGSSSASNSGGNSREQRFIARMRDADGTTARARYREKARGDRVKKQSFDIEIKRAQPGEQFLVRVDGRVIGTVTANNLGFGKLELRRSPSGPNEVPIGSDFPRLRTGAVVTVGSMQGTLSLQ
jgi:hypothetical protein